MEDLSPLATFFLSQAHIFQAKSKPVPRALTQCYYLFASFFFVCVLGCVYPEEWHQWFLWNPALPFYAVQFWLFRASHVQWDSFSWVLNNPLWPEVLCCMSKKKGCWEVLSDLHLERWKMLACFAKTVWFHGFPPQACTAEQALPGGYRRADPVSCSPLLWDGVGGPTHSPVTWSTALLWERVQPWATKPNFTSRSCS